MADEQEEFGVKFAASTEEIKAATEAVEGMSESLKDTIPTIERLRDTVGFLKVRLIELADEYKQGQHTDEAYREASDLVIKALKEQETILKRVTDADREKERAIKETAAAEESYRQKIQDVIDAVDRENEAIHQAEQANKDFQNSLLPMTITSSQVVDALDSVAGKGDDEDSRGGFKGVASNALKAEKVLAGLAGGSGFGRMGPMLESITAALGLAGGTGLAAGGLIFAFEALIPKIETFIEKMTGAAEATARAEKALKDYNAEVKKEEESLSSDEEKASATIKESLKGKGSQEVRQGIEQTLRQEGFGFTPEEQHVLDSSFFTEAQKEGIRDRQPERIQRRVVELMNELRRGAAGATAEVGRMARQRPGEFPAEFGEVLSETTPEARQKAQEADLALDLEDEERKARKAARFAQAKEQNRKNKETRDAVDFAEDFGREITERENKATERALESTMRSDEAFNKQLERDRLHAGRQEERDDKRNARENTPEKQKQRAIGAEIDRQGGQTADPDFVRQVASQASRNVTMGADIAHAVMWAVQQTEAKIMAEFVRGMGQQNRPGQNITPFGGL